LQIILEFIPAERGAILIIGSEIDDLKSVCVFADEVLDDKEMQVSRTVCQQVLSEQVALISNDLSDSNLNTAESLTTSHISSLLCVPLKIGERRGLIYLDSSNLSFRFNKDQLEQMIALSYLISAALTNAESIAQLNRENELLRASMDIETNIIGESEPIRELFYLISRAAPSDSTILIQGESGTGKELVAKTIHQNSLRKQKSYIAINCAVLSESLLESELFGHEKGAFTGAVAYKKGKLEAAEGGTLFLDEVGELAPNIQAKLLRVLQEREFERVGGTRVIKANVRVIAATNRDLEEEVKKGNFRRDLFFRLNVIRIKAPPLRERQSDIPLLIRHFMKKYNEKCNKKISGQKSINQV
jgi:Nif-specific regulatory protein